jgi:hypothetical protein
MSTISLDDLATVHPVPNQKSGLQELFVSDFGDITGSFVEQDDSTEFHASLDSRMVIIRIQRSPRGLAEYVINGNIWYPSGDFRALELEQRQDQLINAVRRYLYL